jgi:hypothetical protein
LKREDLKREDLKREDLKREDLKREDFKREDRWLSGVEAGGHKMYDVRGKRTMAEGVEGGGPKR